MSLAAEAAKGYGVNRRLLAVYDLSVAPTSYDFLTFLALAEMKRRSGNYRCFDVVFVPAPGAGFWDKEATSHEEKVWRLQNLLVPMCWLWPACSTVSVLGSRDEARRVLAAAGRHTYPSKYRLDAPVAEAFQLAHVLAARVCGEPMPSWESPARARDLVARWLEPRARGRRLVTITLREASYYTARNSSVPLWTDFARRLDPQRYFVVFVRDTEKAFEPIADAQGPFETFPMASVNLAVRAALYEASFLSMMPSNGPINLLFFNPSCYGVICDLLNSNAANSSATVLRSVGLEIGRQAPLLGVTKRFVWQPPTPQLLFRAFSDAVELVEGGAERAAVQAASETEPPLRLARRLRETGRYDPSRRIYANELAKQPRSAAAFCGLSLIALEEPRPTYNHWRRLRTRCFAYRRKLSSAFYFLQAWRTGLARWQTTDEAIEIALCLEMWGRRAAAIAIYHAILTLDPAEPTVHYRLGLDACATGERDRAIDELRQAVESDPYTARLHMALAKLLDANGDTEGARGHYALARACDPSISGTRAAS